MEISCNVIRDLLPLYAENMVSEDSKRIVEQHICDCKDCSALLNNTVIPVEVITYGDDAALKAVKRQIDRRRSVTAWFAVWLTAALVCCVWTFLCSPVYLSYEDAIKSVEITDYENQGNFVILEYSDRVEDLAQYVYENEDGVTVEVIMAKTTRMNWLLPPDDPEQQGITFPAAFDIWYRELGVFDNDTLIFGASDDQAALTLQDDPLLPFFLTVGALFAVLTVLLRRFWIWKITAVCAVIGFAGVLADLLATGGSWWFSANDLTPLIGIPSIIIFITGAVVCGYRLFKIRKEAE